MKFRRETIAILAIVGVFVAINLVMAASPSPAFCKLCHSQESDSLRASVHSNVTCNQCHKAPGVPGMLAERTSILGMFGGAVTGLYPRPVKATPSSEACLQCHDNVETRVTEKNGVRMDHKSIAGSGLDCFDCHGDVAHKGVTMNVSVASMDKCLSCHRSGVASTSCETCHTKRVAGVWRTNTSEYQKTHGSNWKRNHGMGNLESCQLCHPGDYCKRCHKIALPHPDSWLNQHGPLAKSNTDAKDGCKTCHQSSFCKSCHKIDMPHPADFLKQHPKLAQSAGKAVCLNCHTEDNCTTCHTRHRHPGIPQDRLKELRKEGGFSG